LDQPASALASDAAQSELLTGGSPIRVRIDVVLEASHATRKYLQYALSKDLTSRFAAALGPASEIEVRLVRSFPLAVGSRVVGIRPESPAALNAADQDKVLHLRIRETYSEFEILAQDYDVSTRYMCPPAQREVRQPARVLDTALEALHAAFSPIAEFEQLPDDPDHVQLRLKLRPAATEGAAELWLRKGDILIPILRRDAPQGESGLPETQVVPWTVLVAESESSDREADKEGRYMSEALARVESSSRRPLGTRRRGRIEQLAVVVRPSPRPVTLRLVTQVEPPQPLSGCHAYFDVAGDDAKESLLVGVSDQSGTIEVPATDERVQVVWIKSGKLLLAKLPVVSGLEDAIEVPLAEDPARIRAEADLEALRTELVDLVARRSILLARGHAAVTAGEIPLARSLADELDKLSTRAQFNLRIDSVAQSARSPDRLAQARIDRLIEETRSVLGRYLDPREIGALRNEIIGATKQPGG
jgi:hypothetical protein